MLNFVIINNRFKKIVQLLISNFCLILNKVSKKINKNYNTYFELNKNYN